MMLHVHKDGTDTPTLVDVANDFNGETENRKQLFGNFSAKDIPKSSLFRQSQKKLKIRETKTKGIVDKCSDLTMTYQEVRFNRMTEAGGGASVSYSLAPPPRPPQSFYAW